MEIIQDILCQIEKRKKRVKDLFDQRQENRDCKVEVRLLSALKLTVERMNFSHEGL